MLRREFIAAVLGCFLIKRKVSQPNVEFTVYNNIDDFFEDIYVPYNTESIFVNDYTIPMLDKTAMVWSKEEFLCFAAKPIKRKYDRIIQNKFWCMQTSHGFLVSSVPKPVKFYHTPNGRINAIILDTEDIALAGKGPG